MGETPRLLPCATCIMRSLYGMGNRAIWGKAFLTGNIS